MFRLRKNRKNKKNKMERGTIGDWYVIGIVAFLAAVGFFMGGGKLPTKYPDLSTVVTTKHTKPQPDKPNLQLYTFPFVTVAQGSPKNSSGVTGSGTSR